MCIISNRYIPSEHTTIINEDVLSNLIVVSNDCKMSDFCSITYYRFISRIQGDPDNRIISNLNSTSDLQ